MIQPKVIQITSKQLDGYVTLTPNVANVRSPIFTFKAKLGQNVLIPNKTKVKDQVLRGYAFIAKLLDGTSTELDGGSLLFLGVQRPSDEAPKYIRRLSYSIWSGLGTDVQRNDDYKAGIAHNVDLNTDTPIVLQPDDQLIVELQSTSVISWATGSYLEFSAGEVNQ